MKAKDLREEVERAKKVIKERDVPLHSLVLASMLASLNELGILNQGTVGVLAKSFTPKVLAYLELKGVVSEGRGARENLEAIFKEFGFKDGEFEIEETGEGIRISVVTNKCKICPKGVGGAELEGAACPVPYMVSTALSVLTGEEWRPELRKAGNKVSPVVKSSGRCEIVVKR